MNSKFAIMISILIVLLVAIPLSFASDNETATAIYENNTLSDSDIDILNEDYYYDSSIDTDGNGSQYNPHNSFNRNNMEDYSTNHLKDGEYDFNGGRSIYNATIIGESAINTIVKKATLTVNTQLNIYNVTFIDSKFINNGNLNLFNCIFKDSSSTMYGGAINSVGKVTINNCTFLNNTAQCGGAVYIKGGSLNINNSLFINNYAELFGGAIMVVNTNTNISGTTFKNNRADSNGGGIYSYYGNFEIYDSLFDNNTADNGAGLFINQANLDIVENNTFTDNVAKTKAGAIFSFYNYNSIIENNTYSGDDELYETFEINMFLGNGNYTLYHYTPSNITDLPSKYDLREFGYVTSVKNQGKDGNCWAFATMATLESNILRALGEEYDLSESNLKNLFMRYGDYGWTLETNTGGYASMGYNYLVSWLGPVLDIYDPYVVNNLFSKVMNSIMHVQNVLFIQRTSLNEIDEIKKLIMDYGAIYSQIYASFSQGKQYYHNGNNANHAISIVGWDDDLQFNGAPGKGGWIIKNSWGPDAGFNGYYYVSYYDTSILPVNKTDGAFIFILNDTMKFDKNYQYDIQGKSDFFLNSSSTVWYKNKFISTDDEYLAAVSTIFDKNTNYTFSIYVNNQLKLTQSGNSKPGYYTFNLDEIIPLKIGDEFVIVFNITVDGDAGVPISEKVSYNKYYYKQNNSFISYDGENWTDLYDIKWEYTTHTYNSATACIKAFTYLNPINARVELMIDNIKNDTLDLIATIYNEWGYLVNHGTVTFNISGQNHTVKIKNGIAKLANISFEDDNNFTALFSAIGYNNSSNYVLFSKNLIQTILTFSNISNHNIVNISSTVKDINGNLIDYGKVIFAIEGENYSAEIKNGVASLNHTFTHLGLNNISAYYEGLYYYNPSNTTITVNITLIKTNLTLNYSNEYNPINITATLVDEYGNNVSGGEVIFTIDNNDFRVNVSNGQAILTHSFPDAGFNNVSAVYIDENNIYDTSNSSTPVNVSKIATKLEIIAFESSNNPADITVTVKDQFDNMINTGTVTFNLSGKIIDVDVENGIAKINHTFTKTGNNTIIATYNDDSYRYNSSKANSTINIVKIKVNMTMDIKNNVEITVEFCEPINEYVHLLIDDDVYKQKTANGKCTFTFDKLQSGNYTVKAYLNSYIYESNNQTGEFHFYYLTSITPDEFNNYTGNAYSVKLTDVTHDEPVKNKTIEFIINNQVFKNNTDENGIALITFSFAGNFNLKINFNGDDDYNASSANVNIEIKPTIISDYEVKTLNSQYQIKLLDKNGTALTNTNVSIVIKSNTYHLKTDDEGIVKLTIDLTPGTYSMKITNPATLEVKTQNIKVVSRITENKAITMYYGAGKYYNVKVFDDNGNIAKGVKVKFTINGKSYTRTTDNKGYASFKISQKPGKYTITAEYKGFKVSNKIKVKTTIITKNKSFKKGKTIKFSAKLLNSKGKILKYKIITFKFKGKKYKVKTNKKGITTLKIAKKYKRGKYTITTKYGKLTVKNTIKIK
ncbi:Ig-like domain repeat protein [Methanobrevibacter sp.]